MLDYTKLKILRETSGVSFSLCKRALEETNNNIKAAEKKLAAWGIEKASQKAKRVTGCGVIMSYVHHNKKIAAMIELNCETDFVANNQDFQVFAQELAMQAASIKTEKNTVEELLSTEYIREPGKTVSDLIKETVLKFGENIKLNRFVRWSL